MLYRERNIGSIRRLRKWWMITSELLSIRLRMTICSCRPVALCSSFLVGFTNRFTCAP
jgi:hypothetical protein